MSPFMEIPPSRWIASNRSAFAVEDAFPVSPGHTLVIPNRLVATWWETTPQERIDLLELVDEVKEWIDDRYHPDGYNVGFNAGAAAGQTVDHLHIHVIPRTWGDINDPRGGIRHVLPGRGNYLADQGFHLLNNQDHTVLSTLRDCLEDRRFDRADLVVSFVMRSGIVLIGPDLEDALDRGMAIRLLTTDYLQTTEPGALARLLDLAESSLGRLQLRIFSDPTTSFHPKGYLFWSSTAGDGRSLVGSSNLSRSGISQGVEWNLSIGPATPLVDEFEILWHDPRVVPLTHNWLRDYQLRYPGLAVRPVSAEPPEEQPEPETSPLARPIQAEALAALASSREAGHGAGLVVLATGLGKTWLAAFFARDVHVGRVLFVAHREEILRQSRDVFRMVIPGCDAGLYVGGERAPDARFVFASVQSLAGALDRWVPGHFDVVVVDEFHHAAAASYRKVLDYFLPEFMLGLTATPERLDGADLLALCGDNLVFECGLVEGIARGELSPFHYRAEKDVADFAPIPWRNGRFDPEALANVVETAERAKQELDTWREHGGQRTLGFCCSVTHAEFMADFFTARDVRAVAVHSGPTSAGRQLTLRQLAAGEIDVIFSVDLFNEGVDVPEVDTILMLRPTDSPVVFLQQLGRGLRYLPDKELKVIDFIGNHRSFLLKPRTLLGMVAGGFSSTADVLEAMRTGDFGLPDGCSIHYDLEVVDLLEELTRREQGSALTQYCVSYFEESGARPTAVQAWLSGYNPGSQTALGWFGALDQMGLLTDAEQPAARLGELLLLLQKESITKSYKLVTLRAVLELGGLREGVDLSALATRARQIMRGDPRLAADVADHLDDDDAAWERYWREWPVAAWTGQLRGSPGSGLFRVAGDHFVPAFEIPDELATATSDLIAELVDYRLCRYLEGKERKSGEWALRVSQTNDRPIIWLNRERNPGLPEGEVDLIVEDRRYRAGFMRIALNVIRDPETGENRLPEILRGWFGPGAGAPGTAQTVWLRARDQGFEMASNRNVDPAVT
jgi:superfamily II DNA or RNA helicase/diadenosine tetraphosphate (Ap4A) HIT family hydrolase